MFDARRVENALNSVHHRWDVYYVRPGCTLGEFLREQLSHLSDTDWPAVAAFAGAYCNGHLTDHTYQLTAPLRIEFYEPRESVAASIACYNHFHPQQHIVFDRAGLLVAYKPNRLHTMPAREQRLYSLKASLEQLFSSEIHMPSRLDFSTAGLVLASRSTSSHDFAQQLFQQRRIKKWYLFATQTALPGFEQHVRHPIGSDPRHPILRKVVPFGGQPAETTIVYLGQHEPDCHVYLARPITGRTHQIRVHAASCGLPLLGDNFYNGQSAPTLHLICAALRFPMPDKTTETVVVPQQLMPDWARSAYSALTRQVLVQE